MKTFSNAFFCKTKNRVYSLPQMQTQSTFFSCFFHLACSVPQALSTTATQRYGWQKHCAGLPQIQLEVGQPAADEMLLGSTYIQPPAYWNGRLTFSFPVFMLLNLEQFSTLVPCSRLKLVPRLYQMCDTIPRRFASSKCCVAEE